MQFSLAVSGELVWRLELFSERYGLSMAEAPAPASRWAACRNAPSNMNIARAEASLGAGVIGVLHDALLPWLADSPAQLVAANALSSLLETALVLAGAGVAALACRIDLPQGDGS